MSLNVVGKYYDITLKIMVMLQTFMRKLGSNFGRREEPSATYVRYLAKRVKETGILSDKPKPGKPKTVRTPEKIAVVTESMLDAPSTSIHCRSQQLNILGTSLRRILL